MALLRGTTAIVTVGVAGVVRICVWPALDMARVVVGAEPSTFCTYQAQ